MFRGARSDSELTLLSKWRASCRIPLLGTSGKEVRQKYHKYQNICCYYKKWAKNYKQGGCPSTGKLLNDC